MSSRRDLTRRVERARERGHGWLTTLAGRFFAVQMVRPWLPIAACAVLAAVAGFLASRLELRTRFEQLLPAHQPSVVELHRVEAHVAVWQNVHVVLEGEDPAALRSLGDTLVPALRALGPPWVTSADDGVQTARAFLEPRAMTFLSLAELEKLRGDLDARWDWEVGKLTGSDLDDTPPPGTSPEELRQRFHPDTSGDRFPDGYFASKDGKVLVVVVRSAVAPGELDAAQRTLDRVKRTVQQVSTAAGFQGIRIGYAGDLVTGLSEYGAVRGDLMHVGAFGLGLVLSIVFLFFMRLRVLLVMGGTIAVGLAWTFGLTEIAIGHLNVASGFLFSIVAGNGINFGIIYMGRFYEEVRGGASPERALIAAHAGTWKSTLTAAVAAAASYGSLGITDFRAFKHFAFIGSAGMLACWIATYAVLPPLLVLCERARPFLHGASERTLWGRLRLHGLRYDRPFAYLVPRLPRALTVAGVGLAIAGFLALVPYLRADPMEYDMRRLQNDLGGSREMYRVSSLANDVLGTQLGDAMVVLCDRLEQVPLLQQTLDARRDAAPPGERPFEAVHSLFDFVPDHLEAKIPVAITIRDRFLRARERGAVDDADWAEIARYLPPPDLAPWTIADLPEDIARPFTERDGTRGRLVLILPTAGKSDADLRYLRRWADSFRETRLPDGSVVRGSGRAVIFADMLEAVEKDMPHAVALSLGMTLISVALTFGLGAPAAAVIGALFVGLGWIAAAMAGFHVKIDFFNFIALPITFGIGVDYAVNFVQRYRTDHRGGILGVLRNTGGPVVLCSLTTTLGYLALLRSVNQAIRGLGLLAVFGEVACLLAAVLVLPASLFWWERASRGKSAGASPFSREPALSERH